MVKLVRKILQNEFGDDTTSSSKRSGKRNNKSQNQARREKREEVQLPPGLLQALKATVDEQQSQASGGGRRSPEERSVRSGQIHSNSSSKATRPIAMGKIATDAKYSDVEESTMALIDSIVKGSDDPALLEALQAMMNESEGDTAYHKETLALVAESIVEKQAAKKALERAAHAETRLQESLKKVAPDLVNDTAAYVDTASGSKHNSSSKSALNRVSASWTSTSASTPVHRRIPVLNIPKKSKNATSQKENTTTNPTGDISVNTLRNVSDTYQGTEDDFSRLLSTTAEQRDDRLAEEQPKKRKNKYKDIVHKKPEIPLYPSYDSRDDQCTFAETFEDRDNYTNFSGSYGEGDETLQSLHTGQSSSESEAEEEEEVHEQEEDEEEEDVELKIEYTLFELESKLSMSSANLSISTGHSSHDQEEEHTDLEEEVEEVESDSGVGDESDSDDEENEPFFASFCHRVQSEDEDEEENDHKSNRGRRSRHTEEKEEAASSILKCVSGYFARGDKDEVGDTADDACDSDDDSTRREKRSRRDRKSRRKEERRSRRSSSGHRHRRRR